VSRRRESLSAAGWALGGAAILVASWRMDRLESRGINPLSIPGLTPGVVGALMIALAIVLAVQARRPSSAATEAAVDDAVEGSARRTLIAIALCVLFAGVTLGSGLPFVAEGAVFIMLFSTVFGWPAWRAEHRVARGLANAAAVAVLASAAISWLFESVFLVRLP
jgi:hypothetical protein